MKRFITILLAVVITIVLLLAMTLGASAKAIRADFTAYEYGCIAQQPENLWMEGDILHVRGYKHVNIDVSDTPEVNGTNTTWADADINMKTGNAFIHGTMSFKPKGIDGTWEGTWVFINSKGINSGSAVAHGTGALEGKSLFLTLYDAPTTPETAGMCADIGEPESSNTRVVGYILDTGKP